jgi:hypothetical protein
VFHFYNAALFVVPLLVAGAFLSNKKYGVITGVLFGLAMIKPQLAVLFFIPLLVNKKYISIGIGILLVIIPLGIASLILKTNPVELVKQTQEMAFQNMANSNAYEANSYYIGFFDAFTHLGVKPQILTLIQTLLFGSIALILCWFYRKAPIPVLFAIPAVFSQCWTYSAAQNYVILAFLILAIVYTLTKDGVPKRAKYILWFILFFCFLPFPEIFRVKFSPILLPLIIRSVWLTGLGLVLYYHREYIAVKKLL